MRLRRADRRLPYPRFNWRPLYFSASCRDCILCECFLRSEACSRNPRSQTLRQISSIHLSQHVSHESSREEYSIRDSKRSVQLCVHHFESTPCNRNGVRRAVLSVCC